MKHIERVMKLIKNGWVFKPTGEFSWSQSHAQVPFAFPMKDRIRVFFSTRDEYSRSSVAFIDLDKDNPEKILYVHNQPVLMHGSKGAFDDSGTMPSWFLEQDGEILLYYTGWNRSESASYRLSIGLAKSTDNGLTFQRVYEGPILDRGKHDPIWVGQPCVIRMSDTDWRMWYLSCQKIEYINNHPEPFYNVKYATSINGVDWKREERTCIDFDIHTDAIGRPCVWVEDGIFKMLHSNRKAYGYRTEPASAYRIEYSESVDGISWERKNEKFPLRKGTSDWDSIMNEYCTTYLVDNKRIVLYNGNGFGASGFGYAIFEV